MNKQQLIKRISKKTGLTQLDCEIVINAFIETIKHETVIKLKPVKLVGFGTFKLLIPKQRNGHNPQTGEKIKYQPIPSIKFYQNKLAKLM